MHECKRGERKGSGGLTWCVNSVSLCGRRLLHENILWPPFVHMPLTRTGHGVLAATNTGTARTWHKANPTIKLSSEHEAHTKMTLIAVNQCMDGWSTKTFLSWISNTDNRGIKYWENSSMIKWLTCEQIKTKTVKERTNFFTMWIPNIFCRTDHGEQIKLKK